MDRYRFEAFNFRGHYIRHRGFRGLITREEGPLDDLAFTLERRGAGPRVALRSVNLPDRYLRHRNFEVWLDQPGGPGDGLFRADSTFFLEEGLAHDGGFSFRSVNLPDRYLRHRNFHLWVEAPSGPGDLQFRKDATFFRRPAPITLADPVLVPVDE